MDQNKLEKLKEIEYKISKCCFFCTYYDYDLIRINGRTFGECYIHRYDHLKHTGKNMKLSVSIFGFCKEFKLNEEISNKYLGRYNQFMEE